MIHSPMVFGPQFPGQQYPGPIVDPGVFNPGGFRVLPQPIYPSLPLAQVSEMTLLSAALAAQTPASGRKRTLVIMLLDDSTSMEAGAQQTRDAYNRQLALVKANAEEVGAEVTQIVFNSSNRLLASHVQAKLAVELNRANYAPSGGTALYDTAAAAVKHALTHPYAACADTAILFYLFTDGDDTSSSAWGAQRRGAREEFRALMKAVRANPRWTVALSGPDMKLAQFADEMAVEHGNVAAFKPESVESRFTAHVGGEMALTNYFSARTMGAMRSVDMYAGTESHALAMSCLQPTPKG